MPTRYIPYAKAALHLLCLLPVLYLLHLYKNGTLAATADPVNLITHFTGDWTLWLLLATLAITPVRRLSPRLSFLIKFRRLIGDYSFFYATLHLATYVFLFSGYDVPTALAGLRSGHPGALWHQWTLVWPTVLDDLKKRRFIQVGLFAWTILLALAVTSPTAVLRAMGGKSWQTLHRLVYAAAIAACIHYWWLVKTHVRTPLPATLILTALLLARVLYTLNKRRKPTPQPAR